MIIFGRSHANYQTRRAAESTRIGIYEYRRPPERLLHLDALTKAPREVVAATTYSNVFFFFFDAVVVFASQPVCRMVRCGGGGPPSNISKSFGKGHFSI